MGSCCDMKGFLSFLTLHLISKGFTCGEDIRKEIEKRKGTKPSPGTIYPVLKSLKQGGLITEESIEGKEKRYKITVHGKKELSSARKKFVAMFCDMKSEF